MAVLALVRAENDPCPLIGEGRWHGEIIDQPEGANGFGYDPHFYLPDLGLTAASLDPAEKNSVSHRPRAARAAGQAQPGLSGAPPFLHPHRSMSITIPIRAESGASRPPGDGLRPDQPAATVALCARALVRAQMPVLRLQFARRAGRGIPERAYLDALRSDLEQALPGIWGRQVVSVFIGGGTPSLLSAAGLDELLAMLRACLNLWPDAEITMEANPGTAEASRFRDYAASGVTRSLGIQSFDDVQLKKLGRIHDAAQARAAIEMAQRAVSRVNLDLMFALPGQTLAACTICARRWPSAPSICRSIT